MSNLLTCRKWWECYPQGPLTWLFPVYHKCLSSKKMCFFSSYTQKHTFFLVSTPWGHSFWNCLNQTLEDWVYISLPNIPNILIIVSVSPDLVLGVPGEILQRLHLGGGELSPDKTRLPWRFPRGKYFRFVRRQILQNVLEYFGLHGIWFVKFRDWKYFLLSSFLRSRIKWEYFCAFVYTILKKYYTNIR